MAKVDIFSLEKLNFLKYKKRRHFPTQVRTCSGFEGLKVTTLFSALIKGSPSDEI